MKEKVGSLPHNKELFEVPEKLILQRISKGLAGSYDDARMYALDTCLVSDIRTLNKSYSIKYILSLINSRLLNFWYYRKYSLPTVSGYELHQLPMKNIGLVQQKPFIELVEKLTILCSNNQNKEVNEKICEYEKQIDELVYKLYALTPDEIAVVEGRKE